MKKILFVTVLSMLMLVLAACGGGEDNTSDESTGGDAAANTVDIDATNWEFDQETYTTSAGDITFNLTNEEGYHGIQIDDTDVTVEGDGSTTASLEAGEYTIRCSIPCGDGHSEMVSTLVVE
ncbi:cytochrome C oxidase subunit II [Aquibacillus sediminis]|uniref:cytochrome C oxidase subunit II n=1 Tax=Aquibacillus sediminis TaxID=2574734 RepID=UPI001107B5C8|nr:cytochrome C oxidase subunit II [Aquibacillus sediminis]